MGIKVEFNPDLALRRPGTRNREASECLPVVLEVGRRYPFLKEGQRNYWLEGEIPLVETMGNGRLSRPLASIVIEEATYFLSREKVYTRGIYRVVAVYDTNNPQIHFEGMNKI